MRITHRRLIVKIGDLQQEAVDAEAAGAEAEAVQKIAERLTALKDRLAFNLEILSRNAFPPPV